MLSKSLKFVIAKKVFLFLLHYIIVFLSEEMDLNFIPFLQNSGVNLDVPLLHGYITLVWTRFRPRIPFSSPFPHVLAQIVEIGFSVSQAKKELSLTVNI